MAIQSEITHYGNKNSQNQSSKQIPSSNIILLSINHVYSYMFFWHGR